MVAALVDAQRADVDEPLELGVAGGVEQEPKRLDVEPAELVERAPVAHLGGAVEHPVGPGDPRSQRLSGSSRSPDDRLHAPLVEPARVARGADQCPDAMASLQCLFGGVAADQPGRAGDEDGFRMTSCSCHSAPIEAEAIRTRADHGILDASPRRKSGPIADRSRRTRRSGGGLRIVARCRLDREMTPNRVA